MAELRNREVFFSRVLGLPNMSKVVRWDLRLAGDFVIQDVLGILDACSFCCVSSFCEEKVGVKYIFIPHGSL